jgi:hypothetical protein
MNMEARPQLGRGKRARGNASDVARHADVLFPRCQNLATLEIVAAVM